MVREIALSWHSRLRIALCIAVTFAVGVLAATAGAPWYLRASAAVLFVAGAGVVLDAVVFTSSWRLTAESLKVPTLLSRRREIAGRDDLNVELLEGARSRLRVTGPNGTRIEPINPLVSSHDLREWFDSLPADE